MSSYPFLSFHQAFDGILIVDGKVQDSHWRAATSDSPSHLWVSVKVAM